MKRKKESEEATRELCMTVEMEEMDPLDKDRKKQQPHKRKPGGGERERERERERFALGCRATHSLLQALKGPCPSSLCHLLCLAHVLLLSDPLQSS